MSGLDDFMDQLEKLEDTEEIAKKCVNAAVPALEESVKNGITEAADRGYATGDLANSVKGTKAKSNDYGVFSAILCTGTDEKGVRNGEKMAYLEYGTTKQDAHPVMQKAVNNVESQCLETMQNTFNAEVG